MGSTGLAGRFQVQGQAPTIAPPFILAVHYTATTDARMSSIGNRYGYTNCAWNKNYHLTLQKVTLMECTIRDNCQWHMWWQLALAPALETIDTHLNMNMTKEMCVHLTTFFLQPIWRATQLPNYYLARANSSTIPTTLCGTSYRKLNHQYWRLLFKHGIQLGSCSINYYIHHRIMY